MMSVDYILDTNILIYLSNQDEKYVDFIENLEGTIGISVISFIEFILGGTPTLVKDIEETFIILDLNKQISKKVAHTLKQRERKNLRNPKLADIVIGHTAGFYEAALITNNADDFKSIKELEIISL